MIAKAVSYLTDHALSPGSLAAYVFALVCVVVATALRYGLGYLSPEISPYAAYFPAVLVAALVAGPLAAATATIVAALLAGYLFDPAERVVQVVNTVFVASCCLVVILVAEAYRRLVRQARASERQKSLMLRELEHRGKNTFAVVEAIVTQTLEHDRETANVITSRIRAVSSTNDIISHAANLEPDLRTLIEAKFEPFGPLRCTLSGPTVTLPADAARNLSLVFHEMVTNALKYGALSQPEGHVDIRWSVDAEALVVEWTERGGPPAAKPERSGFGTRLVLGVLRAIGGRIDADFSPEGLRCVITIPHKKAPADAGASSSIGREHTHAAI